jgi:hypothetical protein
MRRLNTANNHGDLKQLELDINQTTLFKVEKARCLSRCTSLVDSWLHWSPFTILVANKINPVELNVTTSTTESTPTPAPQSSMATLVTKSQLESSVPQSSRNMSLGMASLSSAAVASPPDQSSTPVSPPLVATNCVQCGKNNILWGRVEEEARLMRHKIVQLDEENMKLKKTNVLLTDKLQKMTALSIEAVNMNDVLQKALRRHVPPKQ